MVLRFAYTRPDGGTSIVAAAPKDELAIAIGKRDPETGAPVLSDEEYRKHVIERSIPKDATNIIELPRDWVAPDSDRTFRDAWTLDGGSMKVDMPKAREVMKNMMRFARKAHMEKLDGEYMRADELKNEAQKAAIAAKKQALRDVTESPSIAAAASPDELRAAWPTDVLGENNRFKSKKKRT